MKGIAHFATGLCIASFVPEVVQHHAILIALGGAAALLPDMLDFRFERFFSKIDVVIEPLLQVPSAQALADQLALTMRMVIEDGQERTVQFNPGRNSAGEWQVYSVRFDTNVGNVCIKLGGDQPAAQSAVAYVGPIATSASADEDAIQVGELGGPSVRFARVANAVDVTFLPWHRARTHSLFLAALFGLLAWIFGGPLAGAVTAFGYAAHVLEDQLGYMGSNLFWPLTLTRFKGFQLLHATDAPANMATIWLSLGLLLLNLDRMRDLPLIVISPYLLLGVLLPVGVMLIFQARIIWRHHAPAFANQGRDLWLDVEDGEIGSG